MGEDGATKDDVKLPDGEIGEKITKLFRTDEKDTSKFDDCSNTFGYKWPPDHITDVIVLTAMGEETAIDAKEAPRG